MMNTKLSDDEYLNHSLDILEQNRRKKTI